MPIGWIFEEQRLQTTPLALEAVTHRAVFPTRRYAIDVSLTLLTVKFIKKEQRENIVLLRLVFILAPHMKIHILVFVCTINVSIDLVTVKVIIY